ncbi:Peptidase S8/S53, subtilisin/kexin/sedolisin [Niveomyces insectorum RCEF 264]|uniref:Peptidase S8/S53, subtilisin/kexin/sedolisin n=1 Tax=Niveomyces insectorum RCEF 264 TaxID=1081102 RepID=A0A167PJ96_9HYPO|nr:Peptidase S8/S53, subtilisin/kexin/sedolisin [Niveomyces insectorum RCEF 264]
MDAQSKTALDSAIAAWRKQPYKDNKGFQKELGSLLQSLLDATKNATVHVDKPELKTHQLEPIEKFLKEESQDMDTCVRWHLLLLMIRSTGSGTTTNRSSKNSANTRNVHVQLAKMILESDGAKEYLLFHPPTAKKLTKSCTWKLAGAKRTYVDAPAKFNADTSQTTTDPHIYGKRSDLFSIAVCEGYLHVDALLRVAKDLISRYKSKTDIEVYVRRDVDNLHSAIITCHKEAESAFGQVLREVPGFLESNDTYLLSRIVKDPLLDLAEVVLASVDHRELLTAQDRVVEALKQWMGPDMADGDDDDEGDDNEDVDNRNNEAHEFSQNGHTVSRRDRRRVLMRKILSRAPVRVLRSPEVLTALMQNNLLDNSDILHAYADNENIKDSQKAPKDKNASQQASTNTHPSSASLKFASYLDGIPGILNMAVLYQQQPLVETLLRQKPDLAVTRAFVSINSNGDTLPKKEQPSTTDAAGEGVHNGPDDGKMARGCYPLWYNNETKLPGSPYVKKLDDAKWRQIRSALIYCAMKHAENAQTLLTILRESGEPEREINFDMSRLIIDGTSVADFVTSMPRDAQSSSLIRYEETIRYAEFSSLDRNTQPQTPAAQNQQRSHLEHTHTEVLDMLKWLQDHGVRRIITLRVPDRMAHPHDELEIARVVRRFRVEKLDWRILDLSIKIFETHGEISDVSLTCDVDNDKPAKDDKNRTFRDGRIARLSNKETTSKTYLTQLHLYTGGRRSAVDHWFGAEGLPSTKLKQVYINVIKELTTRKQCDAILKYIRNEAAKLMSRKPEMKIDVQPQFWMAQTETPRLKEIIHHLSSRLAQFIAYYRQKAEECHTDGRKFKPTKVAIIDNGILSMDPPNTPGIHNSSGNNGDDPSNTEKISSESPSGKNRSRSEQHLDSPDFLTTDSLWARVCEGRSFVHEQDRVSPWYLASNPHGTQMANLVCAIDPLCQLFVAKIADNHYGYSAARATAAVNWAISKNVDIISMSFTTTEYYEPFIKAVKDAMERGILVVCSHHDEGARIGTEVYPLNLGGKIDESMLRLASCNRYGKLEHENVTDDAKPNEKYDFCINSEDVAVGAIPFLATSTEHISGSSVATAIAAGVCSLLIACLRTLRAIDVKYMSDVEQDVKRSANFDAMRNNVEHALRAGKNNRPAPRDIKAFLKTMAPSPNNPHFISLDLFASLNDLRDVNTLSLSGVFFKLGAKFTVK